MSSLEQMRPPNHRFTELKGKLKKILKRNRVPGVKFGEMISQVRNPSLAQKLKKINKVINNVTLKYCDFDEYKEFASILCELAQKWNDLEPDAKFFHEYSQMKQQQD